MKIWHRQPTIDGIHQLSKNTLNDHLGIKVTDIGDDSIQATMPVSSATRQPFGLLHGGASAALAETLGSIGANYCIDSDLFYCVGLELNINHVRAVREGLVTGVAKPLHLGRSTQIWEIKINNADNKLSAVSRLTVSVLKRRDLD